VEKKCRYFKREFTSKAEGRDVKELLKYATAAENMLQGVNELNLGGEE
jgi:hypothetical protein